MKVTRTHLGTGRFVVELNLTEALKLAYGPLGSYDESEIGQTAKSLSTGLLEAIAVPSCYSPTDEILEDRAPEPRHLIYHPEAETGLNPADAQALRQVLGLQ